MKSLRHGLGSKDFELSSRKVEDPNLGAVERSLLEYEYSSFMKKLKKVGEFRPLKTNESRFVYTIKRIVEAILLVPCIVVGEILWAIFSTAAGISISKFARKPTLTRWNKALNLARISNSLATTSVAEKESISWDILKLIDVVQELKDPAFVQNLTLGFKLTDSVKLKVFKRLVMSADNTVGSETLLSTIVLLHKNKEMFAEAINRSTNDFLPYLLHHVLKTRLRNVQEDIRYSMMVRGKIVSETYNAFYRPLLLMSYRNVQSLTIENEYDSDLDTVDGCIYELIEQGMTPADIILHMGEHELVEEYVELNEESRGLPHEWVLKIVESNMEDRASAYESSKSWTRFVENS